MIQYPDTQLILASNTTISLSLKLSNAMKDIIIRINQIAIIIYLLNACSSNTYEKYVNLETHGKYFKEIYTDKASYDPSDKVSFTLKLKHQPNEESQLLIRYWRNNNIINYSKLEKLDGDIIQWNWECPNNDFTGYLAEILLLDNGKSIDRINIAIDVSSAWKVFPRYGFISKYDLISDSTVDSIMLNLNRHHINGVQFYDWHYKHHMPLSTRNGEVTESWKDIGRRKIYLRTLEKYLLAAKKYNMKSMAYNLLYGSWADGEKDGALKSWRLYSDSELNNPVKIDFDENWSSDIYWMNPGNDQWQNYLYKQTEKVFTKLPFDGWHVDQLGDWGKMWTAEGEQISPDKTFKDFLINARVYLNRPLVMNAVKQYGQDKIADSPVEFLYSEVWDPDSTFADLQKIINENDSLSSNQLKTVLAAYVNQGIAEKPGKANNAAVLLADAFIFALGGSHLELGEHLLIHPYFPNSNLKMDNELKKGLLNYYDFMVAYQNLLRGELKKSDIEIKSQSDIKLSTEPEKGKIFYIAKSDDNKLVINLVNFSSAATMNWRDNGSIQTEPEILKNITLKIDIEAPIQNIWCASPDNEFIVPIPISFEHEKNSILFQLSNIKYWTALILERE